MKLAYSILFIFNVLILFAYPKKEIINQDQKYKLETANKNYSAGENISMSIIGNNITGSELLFINYSYGKTILKPKISNHKITFLIPKFISRKSGSVSWKLYKNNIEQLKGIFNITASKTGKTNIENYLGPRTILTGDSHYTMMVVSPTDSYDNPITTGTNVSITYQFLEQIKKIAGKIQNFIFWQKIFAPEKSGKLLVSSECKKTTSKEIETEVLPSIARDFLIFYNRNHEYADGNQIMTVKTSLIKDKFSNAIADGTLVTFLINTKEGNILKSFGSSINGIATTKILHPDYAGTYNIKAYINGIAESNTISVSFKPAIYDFKVHFSDKNRLLTIGPLKSFMNQLAPDGTMVKIEILKSGILIGTLKKYSSNGTAKHYFSPEFYKNGNYEFKIICMGVTKHISKKNFQ